MENNSRENRQQGNNAQGSVNDVTSNIEGISLGRPPYQMEGIEASTSGSLTTIYEGHTRTIIREMVNNRSEI